MKKIIFILTFFILYSSCTVKHEDLKKPVYKTKFYRLVQVDKDGTKHISGVIQVTTQ